MTVTADEFIRRFLQHVLPSGFQKVRHSTSNHPTPVLATSGKLVFRDFPCVGR